MRDLLTAPDTLSWTDMVTMWARQRGLSLLATKRGSPQTETSAQAGWDLMSSRSWAGVTSEPSLLVVAMAMNLRHIVGGLFRIWMESVESEEDGADRMG